MKDTLMMGYWAGDVQSVKAVNAMSAEMFNARWNAFCAARARVERKRRNA